MAIQKWKTNLNHVRLLHVAEKGKHHQHKMPDVEGPEGITERTELRARFADKILQHHRADFTCQRPIEVREVEPRDFFAPEPTDDKNNMWFRMPSAEGASQAMQQCFLAYASDLNLLGSALRPHGLTWFKKGLTSLDHAMWFHASVSFQDWHLYTMDSPFSGGRGALTVVLFTHKTEHLSLRCSRRTYA